MVANVTELLLDPLGLVLKSTLVQTPHLGSKDGQWSLKPMSQHSGAIACFGDQSLLTVQQLVDTCY
jgi:hypothetical protein